MPQVSVQPLLPQHGGECSQQRDHKTSVQEGGGSDDPTGGVSSDGGDNRGFVWDRGTIEGEEDRAEEGCGLVVGIGLKLRVDVDGKSRTDGREQTSLRDKVRLLARVHDKRRTNIKVVLRSSSYFLT